MAGGFGNVLFQLTHYFSSVDQGYSPVLIDTLTNKNIITKFLNWKIHDKIYLDIFDELELTTQKQPFLKTVIIMALGKLSQIFNKPVCSVYFFSHQSSNDKYLTSANYIFGYFQSKKYLEINKNQLLKISNLLQTRFNNISLNNNSIVVVHYRYGDSVWARKYNSYYIEVKKHIKTKNNVIIVTDSINEANIFFSDANIQSSQIISNSPLEDFSFMVSANELYCAPSTFSWWAAHCINKNGKVYIPSIIFKKLGFWNDKVKVKII